MQKKENRTGAFGHHSTVSVEGLDAPGCHAWQQDCGRKAKGFFTFETFLE